MRRILGNMTHTTSIIAIIFIYHLHLIQDVVTFGVSKSFVFNNANQTAL